MCKRPNLVQGGHRRIAWERREQRSMRPAEFHSLFWRLPCEDSVEEARRKPITAANPVVHVKLTLGGYVTLAVDPGHRAPTVTIGLMHFAQRGNNDFDLRVALHHFLND